MSEKQIEFIRRIQEERDRQHNLPGSEFDVTNGPNDWVAIICKYVSDGSRLRGVVPSREDFEDSMIKAAAIILAALDHVDHMKNDKKLK